MKHLLKRIFAVAMTLTLCMVTATSFAQSASEDIGLNVGDTVEVDGKEYQVYFIDGDGAHITDHSGTARSARSACPNGGTHNYVRQPGTSSKDVKSASSDYCYVHYTYVISKCTRCGDRVSSLDSSSKKAHKYKLLGKKCTNTVNGKACTYEKK